MLAHPSHSTHHPKRGGGAKRFDEAISNAYNKPETEVAEKNY
jgi:hypothetical protein